MFGAMVGGLSESNSTFKAIVAFDRKFERIWKNAKNKGRSCKRAFFVGKSSKSSEMFAWVLKNDQAVQFESLV